MYTFTVTLTDGTTVKVRGNDVFSSTTGLTVVDKAGLTVGMFLNAVSAQRDELCPVK